MAQSILRIEIARRPDGAGHLACTRPDGTRTWQKQTERQASHFVWHDLTHYAVETTLGCTEGFFGLIGAGWDMEDLDGKGAHGKLPPEAVEVEQIVALLDAERRSGQPFTLDDFALYLPPGLCARLDRETIEAIRASRAALFQRWDAVAPGGKLELEFPL